MIERKGVAELLRMRRIGPGSIPWIFWVALFALNALPWLLFSYYDVQAVQPNWVSRAGMLWGRDFSNQWFGGRLALEGLNVYDNEVYREAISNYGVAAFQNYSYPPHTLLLGAAFSPFRYPIALVLWALAGSILFYRAAKPFVPFSAFLVLLVPSVARLPYGQFGLISSALFLYAMRGSGVAAGLLTMKPHLGILLAGWMVVRKRWRQIIVALAVTLVLLGAAELAFGLGGAFLGDGLKTQTLVLRNALDTGYFNAMPSAYVALRHTGMEWFGQAAAALVALLLIWQFRTAKPEDTAFPLATATFIVLPYSFLYDMALVSVGFAVILYTRWSRLSWPDRIIAILAFSAPNLTRTGFVPVLLVAGLWLQLRLWRSDDVTDTAIVDAPA
jgi:alpha-1,2-mannosyltransferase